MKFISTNPATNKIIAEHGSHSVNEIKSILQSSANAYHEFGRISVGERCNLLESFKQLLQQNLSEIATTISLEMGKPITQSRAEINKSVQLCEFYSSNADAFLFERHLKVDEKNVFLRNDSLGIILGIMPWNFPVWQSLRFAIPTILAGNAVILKPAPNTVLSSLLIENLFKKSFGIEVFKVVLAENKLIPKIIGDALVQGVSLTGSTIAGSKVASIAGKFLKKTVLELGGSDPFIVFPDSDINFAVKCAIQSRMNNTGQTCLAAKRLIVHKDAYKQFRQLLEAEIERLVLGDPFDEKTQISTLARSDIRNTLQNQFDNAKSLGAKVLIDGGSLPGEGSFFKPILLENINRKMSVYKQEVFGPIFSLLQFNGVNEAINIANDSRYGLGASVWTNQTVIQKELSTKLQAGYISINDYVRSDPRVPFGGVKDSGYGRELGEDGIKEFTNLKSVLI